MAKKKSGDGANKSQAIRDFEAANPGAGPKAISQGLKAQGIDVSPAYVSTIRTLGKKKKRKGKRGRKAAAATSAAPTSAPTSNEFLSVLIKAKKLAVQLGGVSQAKAALDALAKLGE